MISLYSQEIFLLVRRWFEGGMKYEELSDHVDKLILKYGKGMPLFERSKENEKSI